MKIYFPITLVFLISLSSFSQKKDEYFLSILDSAKTNVIRLNALDSLSNNYKNPNNFEDFADYVEKFVDLAIQQKEYERAATKAINGFFTINDRLGKRERALRLLNKIEKHTSKIKDSSILGKLYLKKGGGFFNGKDFNSALKNYNLATFFLRDKDSIFKADAIYFTGQVYFEKGSYLKALNSFLIAGEYYKNLGDLEYYNHTKQSTISIYGTLGFNEKSIQERKKFIEEKIKLNLENGLIVDYYNLASSYKKTKNYNQQLNYLLKADSIANKTKGITPYYLININTALAKFYADTDLKKAKKRIQKVKDIIKTMDDNVYGYQFYRITKGYILYKEKKYKKAKKILFKALKQSKDSYEVTDQIELYRILSLVYSELKSHSKEVFYFKKYIHKKDSLQKITNLNSFNYYQSLFENELQEKKITEQKASIQLLKSKNEGKKIVIFLVSIGFGLFVIVAILFSKRMALKRKKIQREQYAQNLLLSQEKERKRIAKDLHDGLGQSLLVIKNEASLRKDEKIKRLIDGSINEIRSISKGLHPFQLQQIGINNALENLVAEIDQSFKNIYIFGDFDNIKGVLTKDQELNLFRILQESLSNIIKHSEAKSARITLLNKDSNLYLYIKDNGIGFDFSKKYNNPNSLGLKTIRERVRFLNGTIKVDSFIKGGTSITIKIPKNE